MSPQKRQSTVARAGTVGNSGQTSTSKKDILSCLEISRIDSNRKQEVVNNIINKLPGQNPGGILN